jgi:hypothetical protein
MQVIEAFEQDDERQGGHRAQNKAVTERQFGSLEYDVVVVNPSHSKGYAYNTAKA